MFDNKWNVRFMEMARYVASWSKDPSTQVGAVIVRPDKTIASVGFNGFPRGVDDVEERYYNREQKYRLVVHAELNAILNAKEPLNDCTIYIWPTLHLPATCNECAKSIIQSGIKKIVCYLNTGNVHRETDYIEDVRQMYKEAGVEWHAYPAPDKINKEKDLTKPAE